MEEPSCRKGEDRIIDCSATVAQKDIIIVMREETEIHNGLKKKKARKIVNKMLSRWWDGVASENWKEGGAHDKDMPSGWSM